MYKVYLYDAFNSHRICLTTELIQNMQELTGQKMENKIKEKLSRNHKSDTDFKPVEAKESGPQFLKVINFL